ncbi:P-loop NTPase fold protein [Cohnella abietis]|uniref:KAP NTPase domain-containing protein n=1 Tax=Cohnella abietis TaxID=2507935 RepID=A0A3T1D7B1_9BACL|nr:P-loop NTPase fold protein [Cohnella abietis]BBI33964.1 hypothetical protein KCTCHS21_33630 [Cohnella abietis]
MKLFIEMFRRYMDSPKTEYALHLDGSWGSGKTYFVKNEIRVFLEENYPSYQLVYISLNGIKDTNEIGENVFLQILSPSAAKGYIFVRGAINLFKNFIPIGSPSEIDVTNVDSKIQDLINKRESGNIFLCIDDLERTDPAISIENILGYINSNFIEHNHVKTLFISNSEEIRDHEAFTKLKEKVIGRTIKFQVENLAVIYELIKTNYPLLYPFFEENKESMTAIFATIENINLRTIKFVFGIMAEIFETIENEELTNDVRMSLFACILVIGIEYKIGTIKSIKEAEDNLNRYNLFFKSKQTESRFLSSKIAIKDFFSYFQSIAQFIITGDLNSSKLFDEIGQKYRKENEPDIHFRIVENYYNFEVEEVNNGVNRVISSLKEGYYNPLQHPYMYMVLKEVITNVNYDLEEDLFEVIREGLLLSIESKIDTITLDSEHIVNRYFSNITDEKSLELIEIIRGLVKQHEVFMTRNKVNEFIQALVDFENIELIKHINSFSSSKNLFMNLINENFQEQLIKMKNKSIKLFITVLNEMYLRISNASDYYFVEIPYMTIFKEELKRLLIGIHGDLDVLKRTLISELVNEIEKIINHVDNDNKEPVNSSTIC